MQQAPAMFTVGLNGKGEAMFIQEPTQRRPPVQWSPRRAKALGITLILLSLALSIGNIVLVTSIASYMVAYASFLGGGLMLVTGVLMGVSGYRPSRSLILAVLVTSIVTIVAELVPCLFLSRIPVPDDGALPIRGNFSTSFITVGILFVFFGILSFALLLTASILSCMSLCSRRAAPWEMVISQGSAHQSQHPGFPSNSDSMAMNYVADPHAAFAVPPPRYS